MEPYGQTTRDEFQSTPQNLRYWTCTDKISDRKHFQRRT